MRVERRLFLRSSAAFAGAGMLGSGPGHAEQIHVHHVHGASRMTECANRFLAALDANQRGKATFPFESDERMNWHFIPKERKGLPRAPWQPCRAVSRSSHPASVIARLGTNPARVITSITSAPHNSYIGSRCPLCQFPIRCY